MNKYAEMVADILRILSIWFLISLSFNGRISDSIEHRLSICNIFNVKNVQLLNRAVK